MTPESEKEEPPEYLGFGYEYWNQCACTSFDHNFGAGVNAGSTFDTLFAGTDRLSELVWSPKNGICVRCADGGTSMERPYVLCNTAPRNRSLVSPKFDTPTVSNIATFPDIQSQGQSSGRIVPTHCLTSRKRKWPLDTSHQSKESDDDRLDCMERIVGTSSAADTNYETNDGRKDVADLRIDGNDPASVTVYTDGINRIEEDPLATEACSLEEIGDSVEQKRGPFASREHKLWTIKKRKSRSDPGYCDRRSTEVPLAGKTCSVATDIISHQSSDEERVNWQEDKIGEDRIVTDCPSSSRRQIINGKCLRRDLSHENMSLRVFTEKNNSDESVESCSRAGFLSTVQLAEPSVIIGSKQLHSHIQNSSSTLPYCGQGSSFMIWISNMVKGYRGSGCDKVPPLRLGTEHSGNTSHQHLVGCNKNLQSASFPACSGSFHHPHRKPQEKYSLQLTHHGEKSRVFKHNDESSDANAIPLLRHTDATCSITELNNDVNLTPSVKGMANSIPAIHKVRDKDVPVRIRKLIDVVDLNSQERRTIFSPDEAEQRSKSHQIDKACSEKRKGFNRSWVAHFNPKVSVSLSKEDCYQSVVQAHCSTDVTEFVDDANRELNLMDSVPDVSSLSRRCKNEGLALKDHAEGSARETLPTKLRGSTKTFDYLLQSKGHECYFPIAETPIKGERHNIPTIEETNPGSTKSISSQYEDVIRLNEVDPESAVGCSLALNSFSRTPLNVNLPPGYPKPIFDAVKSLQVSRSDISRWMHAHMPLSHLDGLFLRLRHGKWSARLSDSGYIVACITGEQRENLPENSKISLAVTFEGTNCLVECQYISNQQFLEDELIAWWSSASQGGGEMPSCEDLRSKFEKRRLLGI